MAQIGNGYGSECHLLRWMGRHRREFDRRVLEILGQAGGSIEWEDFKFDPGKEWPDAELKGLEFLSRSAFSPLLTEWKAFWPLGRGIHNWDAVGWLAVSNEHQQLLLVEAKAEANEIKSDCGAEDPRSIKMIGDSFHRVQTALGVDPERDWMNRYYQMSNRIALLWFLHEQDLRAHLVNIYFFGDRQDRGRISPQSEAEWMPFIRQQEAYLGLPEEHLLNPWMHKLFLPVSG